MSRPQASFVQREASNDLEGLRDGGEVLVHCSNCRARLLQLKRTRPHEPYTWKVKANCPFCGDHSFVVEVQGGFHAGGAHTIKEDDPDDCIPSTHWTHNEIEGDTFVFTVEKSHPEAMPIHD